MRVDPQNVGKGKCFHKYTFYEGDPQVSKLHH